MGRSVGSTDGSEVASGALNSSPGGSKVPIGLGVPLCFVSTFVLAETTGFVLTAVPLGVGSAVRNSLSLPPFSAVTGAPDGSKLTEGISDSHHFPRTFTIS